MSDARLREAERRWRETGSVDDEARFLLERVRVGDLPRERLELAAYCGNRAAGAATGRSTGPDELGAWLRGLRHIGQWSWIRTIALSVELALRKWPDSQRRAFIAARVAQLEAWCSSWEASGLGAEPPPAVALAPRPQAGAAWIGVDRLLFQSLDLMTKRLAAETSDWATESPATLRLPPETARALLTRLEEVGATVELRDGALVLREVGIRSDLVLRALAQVGRLTPEEVQRPFLQASKLSLVFEAWDFGRDDRRWTLCSRLGRLD